MILKEKEKMEVSSVGFDDDFSEESYISPELLGYIMSKLSDQYSRPIDSIVRELTSNCFDSHSMAKTDKAVRVGIRQDENAQDYVFFKDVGLGLSEKDFKKVYLGFGNSLKREINYVDGKPVLGAFGFGSKSPFAYRDDFHIISIHDGKKSEYYYFKENDFAKPKLERDIYEDTDEPNGVEVRIFLKSDYDKVKFIAAFKKELVYFDNVWFEDDVVDNNYQIHEFKTFKFRSDIYSREYLHICYGRAKYPIDFSALGINSIRVPVGLKIDIGDIEPTPERENIKYDQETIELLKAKIEDFKSEVEGIHKKQLVTLTDMFEYKCRCYEKGSIMIDDLRIDTSDLNSNNYLYEYHLKECKSKRILDYRLLYDSLIVEVSQVINGRITKKLDIIPSRSKSNLIRVPSNFKHDTIKNKHIGDALFIRKKSVINYKALVYNLKSYYNLKTDKDGTVLIKCRRIIQDFYKNLNLYSQSYNKIVVPEEFILAHKKDRNRLESGSIIIHQTNKRSSYEGYNSRKTTYVDLLPKKEQRTEVKLKDFLNRKNSLIVYGTPDDEHMLNKIEEMFPINPKHVALMYTSKTNQKYFQHLKCKNISISRFMEGKNRIVARCVTAYKVRALLNSFTNTTIRSNDLTGLNTSYYDRQKIKKNTSSFEQILRILNDNIADKIDALKLFVDSVRIPSDDDLMEGLVKLTDEHNVYDFEILKEYDEVRNYIEGLSLLKSIHLNEESLPEIILMVKALGKKVNLKYYTVLTRDYELELYRDLQVKKSYNKFIKENNADSSWNKVEDSLKQILKIA